MTAYSRSLIKAELTVIQERLARVLDGTAQSVLDSCKKQISNSPKPENSWRFVIGRSRPLQFRQAGIKDSKDVKFDMTIDVSGIFPSPVNGSPSAGHSVVVRMWSSDKAIWYDQHLDSQALLKGVSPSKGRVVHRFHFDRGTSPNEPWSHLHIGGRDREDDEFFRFPEELGLPRFHHHPMGLMQTCEFIVYHFFPGEYKEVSRDPSWQYCLSLSEKAYIGAYCVRLKEFVRDWPSRSGFHQHCCSVS